MSIKKNKKKQQQSSKAVRVLRVGLIGFIFSLVAGFIICLLLINHYADHMVLSYVFIKLMVACLTLLLAIGFIWVFSLIRKILGKIVLGLFAALFFAASISSIVTSIQLLQDKEMYENGEYEVITGKPANIDYDTPKGSDTTYVYSFEINGLLIMTDHLAIEQTYFDLYLKDKIVVVKYLPNSQFAVEVNGTRGRYSSFMRVSIFSNPFKFQQFYESDRTSI